VNEGTITIRYSDIWSSYASSDNSLADIGQHGNFSADPKFKNRALGDYRLNYGSPCIDAADSTVAPPTDLMGAPRYSDPRTVVKAGILSSTGAYADLGPYEFVETAASDLDLIATQVSGPASVTAGDLVPVQWTVANLGSGLAVGPWHDTVYLAPAGGADAPLSVAEVLDGTLSLGPGETVTISNSVRVPGGAEGNYQWQVRVNSRGEVFEGINWTNNLASGAATVQLQVPALVVGANPIPHQFSTEGESQWFKVQLPAGQDVLVTLSSTNASSALELYSGQGYMPTRLNYDGQQTASSGSAATLLLANGAARTCYLLLYAKSLPGGAASYSLAATVLDFSLTEISSAKRVGNTGPVTFDVRGGKLAANLAYQVIGPDGQAIAATTVYAVNSSEVFVTFDLSGHPLGNYQLRAGQSGRTVTLANAIEVINGNPGHVDVNVACPANIRPNKEGVVVIQYRNTGDVDVTAPLMQLQAENANLRFDAQSDYVGPSVWLLGLNREGPAGILPPGAAGSVELRFLAGAAASCTFNVRQPPSTETPATWGSLKETLRPEDVLPAAWDAIYANYVARVGTTMGQYQRVLAQDATYLAQLGKYVTEVKTLAGFELFQAGQAGAISRRYNLGAFGRGQLDPTDIAAVTNAAGDVRIRVSQTFVRLFRRQGDGSYLAFPGDYGRLTVTNGHYQIGEPDGKIIAFRTDGKLDYVEDPNHNRMTCAYTNGLLTSWTDSWGDVQRLTYNVQGRVIRLTDPVGRNTLFTYDALGEHLISVVAADGTTNSFTYITGEGAAREHALASVTSADGTRLNLEYDDRGALHRMSEAGGRTTLTIASDSPGGITVADGNGASVKLLYDHLGQLSKLIDPFGNLTRLDYDANHNLTRVASPGGLSSTLTYDDRGNVITGMDGLGRHLDMTYDATLNAPVSPHP
jgi:YD repeat-containing protein